MKKKLMNWWHAECAITRPLMDVDESGEMEHNTNGMLVMEVLGVIATIAVIGLTNWILG